MRKRKRIFFNGKKWWRIIAVTLLFLGNGGYGTLVWVVVTEMLHPRVRAATNAINICLSFILGFVVSKVFVDLSLAIGSILNERSWDIDKLTSMFQELVEHSGFTGQFVLLELFLHSSLYQKPKGRVLKRYRKCFKTELFEIRYSVGFNFTKVSKDRLLYLKINHSFNCRNHSLWDLSSQCTSQWTPINSITTDSRKLVLIVWTLNQVLHEYHKSLTYKGWIYLDIVLYLSAKITMNIAITRVMMSLHPSSRSRRLFLHSYVLTMKAIRKLWYFDPPVVK